MPVDINLGLDFLKLHQAVINISENTLKLDDKEIEFNDLNKDFKESPDQTLIDKILLKSEASLEKELEKLVNKAKNENLTIGNYKEIKHEIILKENKPIASKPYYLPPKLFPQINQEIKRLLGLGIIRHSTSVFAYLHSQFLKKNNEIRLELILEN
jgi:hypothetical protein